MCSAESFISHPDGGIIDLIRGTKSGEATSALMQKIHEVKQSALLSATF